MKEMFIKLGLVAVFGLNMACLSTLSMTSMRKIVNVKIYKNTINGF